MGLDSIFEKRCNVCDIRKKGKKEKVKGNRSGRGGSEASTRSNWYFNGLAGGGGKKQRRVLENHFSGHKRETKELMEAAETTHPPPPSSSSCVGERCSVFTAINSEREENSTPSPLPPRSNAARYNLFKLASGLFMKKLGGAGAAKWRVEDVARYTISLSIFPLRD